jgi:uncharacterized protein with HEPN domain
MDGVDRPTFEQERLLQDGVTRQLEIIGEASRQLSEAFRARHAEVPWRAIVGMRHRIVHDYLNIDLEVIWDTVHHDLPGLKRFVRSWLRAGGRA